MGMGLWPPIVEYLDEDWVLEAYLKIIHRAGKQMAWVGEGALREEDPRRLATISMMVRLPTNSIISLRLNVLALH